MTLRYETGTVAVVTPWRDHRDLRHDYMAALKIGPEPDELIVVDNASDPPIDFARIRLSQNHGFAAASNIGLRAATSDIVVFLNNDIAASERGWLNRLAAAVKPGVLAGAALRHDSHGDVDGDGFPYLDGWCLAGTRADLMSLGGFSQAFVEPAYYSDNDLCFRARLAGMRLVEVPVGVRHKGNVTAGGFSEPRVQAAKATNYELFAASVRASVPRC